LQINELQVANSPGVTSSGSTIRLLFAAICFIVRSTGNVMFSSISVLLADADRKRFSRDASACGEMVEDR
jgi:hypothetical protein